jgi:hypothetical protein
MVLIFIMLKMQRCRRFFGKHFQNYPSGGGTDMGRIVADIS